MLFGAMPFQYPEQERDEAIKIANRWLAKFAPLLDVQESDSGSTLRYRLKTLIELKAEGESTRQIIHAHDLVLADTVAKALTQLPQIEDDIRDKLGFLEPGNPEGNVDLDALRDRLAAREAQAEVESSFGELPNTAQPLVVHGNPIAGIGMGLFGLAWTSFTTFHAFFMIGGMFRQFGFPALFLLLFYSLFFAVGFGMLYGAWRSAAKEEIELEDGALVQRLTLGAIKTRKRVEFVGKPVARVERAKVQQEGKTSWVVNVWDEKGMRIALASTADRQKQNLVASRLNAHFSRTRA